MKKLQIGMIVLFFVLLAVPMVLSVIGTVGTRILWVYVFFPHHRSLYFLFISYPGSWLITIAMQAVCFFYVRKQCIRQLEKE